jgi:hypothetical protein
MMMIKKHNVHPIYKKLSLLVVAICMSFSVSAISLDQAKQRGLVGEMPDGYLGVVVANNNVNTLVATVNKKRKDIYINLARKNKITLQQISQLAGDKSIAKTKAGHFIKNASGNWVKK